MHCGWSSQGKRDVGPQKDACGVLSDNGKPLALM